jgi:predicted RNase H-like HicB family nuclease
MPYLAIYKKTETEYDAYVPDFQGCMVTGESKVDVFLTINDAIEFYIEGLESEGYVIPLPTSEYELMEVV